MLTKRAVWLASVICMALVTGALAQEGRSPTFGERLSRFGRGLFDRSATEEPPHRTTGFGNPDEEFDDYRQSDYPPEMAPAPQRRPAGAPAQQPRATAPSTPGNANNLAPQRTVAQPGTPPRATSQAGSPARSVDAEPAAPRSSRRTAQPEFATNPAQATPTTGAASGRRATAGGAPSENPWSSQPVAADPRPLAPPRAAVAETPVQRQPAFNKPSAEMTVEDRDPHEQLADTPAVPANPYSAPATGRSLHGRLEKARESTPAEQGQYATDGMPRPPAAEVAKPLPESRVARSTRAVGVPTPQARGEGDTAEILFEQQGPVLRVHATGPQRIRVGVVSVYTLRVENSGNMAAEEVVVAVRIPEGADLANTHPRDGSARPSSAVDGSPTLEWSLPRLGAGETSELALGLIPRRNEAFDLTAVWTHAPVGSLASIEVQEAKLLMTLTGPEEVFFGEREVYKLTLSNPGNGDAENVMVRLLPTSPSDDQAVSHNLGTLRAGENRVVELELTARQVGTLRLKAEAMADGGLLASVDEEVLVRRADLRIDIEGPPLLYAGTVGVYRLNVSNPGNAVAKNVQISAVLPAGANFIECSDGGVYSPEHGRIVWTTSNLRPGAEWSCTYRCELNHEGPNTVQVTGIADGDLRKVAAIDTEVEALADLTLSVKDPPGPLPVGEELIYEVRIKNRGTKAAEGIDIVAFFSPGIEPVDVQGGPYEVGPGQVSLARIATLAPGQDMLFKIRARAHRAGTHIFRAELECPALETRLAAEETTRFYGDAISSSSSTVEEFVPADDSDTDSLLPVPNEP